MQTGENSILEARMLYHSNSYAYLFAVKYKFTTLWLNTTINSSALSGLLHSINHLRGVRSMGSQVALRTSCI